MKRLIPLFFFVLASGCTKGPSKEDIPDYIVWCELLQGDRFQFVQVDRIYSPEETKGEGVSDALVRIINGSDTVQFHPVIRQDTTGKVLFYEDSTALSWLFPLETYTLQVFFPDGSSLEDTTTIPGSFEIISLEEGDTLDLPWNEKLCWKKSENALFYVLYARGPFVDTVIPQDTKEDTTFKEILFFATDTLSDFLAHALLFPDTGWYWLEIRAENEEAYLWNLKEQSSFMEDWVTGVFGGLTKDGVWLYLRP